MATAVTEAMDIKVMDSNTITITNLNTTIMGIIMVVVIIVIMARNENTNSLLFERTPSEESDQIRCLGINAILRAILTYYVLTVNITHYY